MSQKKTLVLGASENPARYSNMAVRKLASKQHPVIAVGRRPGKIDNVEIIKGQPPHEEIDTVTLYLNPTNQKEYYDYILSLNLLLSFHLPIYATQFRLFNCFIRLIVLQSAVRGGTREKFHNFCRVIKMCSLNTITLRNYIKIY